MVTLLLYYQFNQGLLAHGAASKLAGPGAHCSGAAAADFLIISNRYFDVLRSLATILAAISSLKGTYRGTSSRGKIFNSKALPSRISIPN